ncbi:DUF4362 domain-containing protein [Paenibacillus dakarensis]|uniref:DUF4362 domain-containing protein n=1 Tax=Paenibacillus dakarensis TaxID=1527293 RepID=UPI0006D58A08|nr:DUF4362 domain-containing protein [Paenibacillus dakarensis]
MSNRLLNYILLTIILVLIIVLIITNKDRSGKEESRNEFFLVNFDNKDFKRLEELANRFKEGKGDNLMLIPPIIDGGYWIHDVMSNGSEIYWAVDNSRDGMSSNRGKAEYICKAIDIRESEDHYTFELSKCNNFKEDEKLGMVSFLKERL